MKTDILSVEAALIFFWIKIQSYSDWINNDRSEFTDTYPHYITEGAD